MTAVPSSGSASIGRQRGIMQRSATQGQATVKVFLSYAHDDEEIAREVSAFLAARSFDVWTMDSLIPGTDFVSSISQAISEADVVAVIVSKKSARSPWVQNEYAAAVARVAQGESKTIIPVLVDDAEIPFFLSSFMGIRYFGKDRNSGSLERLADAMERSTRPVSVETRLDSVAQYLADSSLVLEAERLAHEREKLVRSARLARRVLLALEAVVLAGTVVFAVILALSASDPPQWLFWSLQAITLTVGGAVTTCSVWFLRRLRRTRGDEEDRGGA